MTLSRRRFLAGTGAVAGLGLLSRAGLADARGLLTDPLLDQVLHAALDAAKAEGASYSDVRIVRRRNEQLYTREDHVEWVNADESYGFGIRVLVSGAWGFAATSRVDPAETKRVAQLAAQIARANAKVQTRPVELAPNPAHVDVWQTPLVKDPFKIPLEEKAELLLAINAEAMKTPGVRFCTSYYLGAGEWKLFASSDGAYIEQNITRVQPAYVVTAVSPQTGEFVTRQHDFQPRQAGWEYVEDSPLLADARRMGEEAVEKLKAPSVEPGKKDLILSPENLFLTIHESVGHPTELDRAMGLEANFAGTSFATPEKLNKLQYGSALVNIYGDKTTPGGLATCGYDDEGVKTRKFDLVKGGRFVGYQTTRDEAAWVGEKESRGTSYAQDFKSIPFQRMPNVSLAPGDKDLGVKELIASTEDGIYIVGDGSWSIDQQRYNFQFGGQMFYEVKHGKVTRALKDVAYQANTLQFWNSCVAVGGPREWKLNGAFGDGKGEPMQIQAVSHGCPPAKFAQINILNTNARKKA